MSAEQYESIAVLLKFAEQMTGSLRGALVLVDTDRDPTPNLLRAEESYRRIVFLARAAFTADERIAMTGAAIRDEGGAE